MAASEKLSKTIVWEPSAPVLQWHWGTGAPVHRCSSARVLQWSSGPVLQCPSASVVQCSNAPVLQWSNAPVLQWSIAPMPQCFSGPIVQCSTVPASQRRVAPLPPEAPPNPSGGAVRRARKACPRASKTAQRVGLSHALQDRASQVQFPSRQLGVLCESSLAVLCGHCCVVTCDARAMVRNAKPISFKRRESRRHHALTPLPP